jgi:PAS domain S-box-containing protein
MINNLEVLKSIIESSAEGIVIANKEGAILLANPQSERLFGYAPGELLNRKIEDLIPDRFRRSHQAHRERYAAQPKPRSMGQGLGLFAIRKDGTEFPIEVSLSHASVQGEVYFIAFIINITERKLQEQKLLKSEERLRYFVEHTPVAVAMTDKHFRYLLVSTTWLRDYGRGHEQLIGLQHLEVFPDFQEDWLKHYQEALKGKVYRCEEDVVQRADGSKDWLRWEVHPWRDEAGEIGGLVIFVEDITKRKIAENALRQSRAKLKKYTAELERSNKELENFAYISSHDLQEPLRKIQAFGDRLRTTEYASLSERGRDYVDRMFNSAARMQTLINDLLAFSRLSTKQVNLGKIDLNQTVREVLSDLELVIEQTKAIISLDPLPTVEADATQMRQLFQNLITNAMKFTKNGVTPEVNIKCQVYRESVNEQEEEFAEISVSDNGIGFEERFIDRIFNIFQRLEGQKYPGSGIGLAVCKKIAQRHGGDITAKSKPGEGATFIVKLPLKQNTDSK